MHTDTALSIKPFGVEHLPGAAALSREESWPHRIEDWSLIHGLSRGVVAVADGQVEGTTMITRFGRVALANMIIVGKGLRGKGVGRQLLETAMALEAPDEWRLVATADGLPLYRKLGFEETGVIAQHQGVLPASSSPDERIGLAVPDEAVRLAALDTEATGMERLALIRAILNVGRVAVLRQAGEIAGYAGLRPFGRGEVAGPVIATGPDEARALLAFLFADRAGRFVRVDTSADSGLSHWLEQAGLARVSEGVAMSRFDGPAIGHSAGAAKSFALAAQALG